MNKRVQAEGKELPVDLDHTFMGLALEQAAASAAMGEVPVGAVLVAGNGDLLAAAGNNCIKLSDPTGHAEIHVLRKAAQHMANYRLPSTTMYVTLEPCVMCAAAMVHARVGRIVFGAVDPKAGGLCSVYQIGSDRQLNHTFSITAGVRAEECSWILKDFFRRRR
jgi:tRNA(adenine34) deaminase